MKNYSHLSINIATRQSELALWQAKFIKAQLEMIYPGIIINLLKVMTIGDKILGTPLAKIGGKGLFIKELEKAILAGNADFAVHSMKDVPTIFPETLCLAAICKRANPFDAWVSKKPFLRLPAGSRVGTCSLRRQVQLKALRSDLLYYDLRGNVNTRLRKLNEHLYDGIVLAVAGLQRLGFTHKIQSIFSEQEVLPAVGQGAIGIECHRENTMIQELLAPLICQETTTCVMAERAMNEKLGGSCQVPIAGFAQLIDGTLILQGRVGNLTGTKVLAAKAKGDKNDPLTLGFQVAKDLLQQGAQQMLDEVLRNNH